MKILLPVDGSTAATAAVRFVRSLAATNPVDAVVMMVSYDPSHYSMQPWVPEWTDRENERVQEILDEAKQVLESSCQSVASIHKPGAIVPCILEQAKACDADLIVLGAKGHSAIRRVLLGSVSDSIATRAECSVVVARGDATAANGPSRILLGFDRSVASREAVAELMEWNLNRDAHVDVVSVAQPPYIFVGDGYAGPPMVLEPEQTDTVRETAERMASQIAEHFPHTQSHSPVAPHVGEAIVQQAEDSHANLIVVGDTSHGFLGELVLGSTSKYVLRHAHCSVWISRHHWKDSDAKCSSTQAALTKNNGQHANES